MNLTDGVTSYDFILLPAKMTMIRPDKTNSSKLTFEDVAYYSWGVSIIGKEIVLKWNACPASQFAQFDTFYAADAPLIFDPTLTAVPADTTYNVEMKSLDGDYLFGGYDTTLDTSWRENVTMTLLILSEVA